MPGLLITDPDNVREVLSKSYIFQKPKNPLGKMLAQGLATYETDKWAKHKRLITPAFQLHKVKVHFLISSFARLIFKTVISVKKKMTIEHFDTYSICFQYSMRVVLKC